ncbi:DOMON domain-containing protein [Desulforhopalus singaporensis]|uniref:DOMON domain-containing protein n=1 Tax=Desulforhopalus singaporensis TaxID=91360 RepID=A0A1H0U9X3_9BACT|nr:DOMON domain-containing protein [Desulforhopalus singaporensis]SDP62969.1 DOMON domain-containing protein [Desulforhopalus singaporensis]
MIVRKKIAAVLSAYLWLTLSVVAVSANEYTHQLGDEKINFAWNVDGDKLQVKISGKTEGWVGIGFNPSKEMKDANFILGYVKKGEVKITDEFGVETNGHQPDRKLGGQDDAVLVGGTEENGTTVIEFVINLKSADAYDSSIDVNGDTIVLLAYGAGRDSFRTKHKYRVEYKVNLATGAAEKM